MSTVLLALALIVGLGLISFLISVGLAGLGVLLSWIFPFTPFQGTLLNLVLFSLALAFMGGSLLFERLKRYLLDFCGRTECLGRRGRVPRTH
jgi:membrane protein implicated in regulation of membrane protease activity